LNNVTYLNLKFENCSTMTKRNVKKISNYFPKQKLYVINNEKKLRKKNKPFNLALLIEQIQNFIFKNVALLKPKSTLDFLLDPKLKNFLIENFNVTKRLFFFLFKLNFKRVEKNLGFQN